MKIPVLHYTEIETLDDINQVELGDGSYLTNEANQLYLVEVWA